MATYTHIIDPGNEQTGWTTNYTSLNAWAAAEAANYTSGDIVVADCRRSTSAYDSLSANLSAFVATPHIIVHPDYRHEGKNADQREDGNYIYKFKAALTLRRSSALVDGIFFDFGDASKHLATTYYSPKATGITVKNCFFLNPYYRAILGDDYRTGYYYNNIFLVNSGRTSSYQLVDEGSGSNSRVYNNTFYSTSSFACCDRAGLVHNNIMISTHSTPVSNTKTDENYNIFSDVDGGSGANDINGASIEDLDFVSVTPGSEDFHIGSSSIARGAGTDLSADLTDDIDGDIRSSWDIGADEYASLLSADNLIATSITTGTSVIGSPSIGQAHVLAASGIVSGGPATGLPVIKQIYNLAGIDILLGSPAIENPSLSENTDTLTASDIITGTPVVELPVISQIHNLAVSGVTTGAFEINRPVIAQTHNLNTADIEIQSPEIDTPTLETQAGTDALTAVSVTAGTPQVGSPAMAQAHVLAAVSILCAAADIERPRLDWSQPDVPAERTFIVPYENRTFTVPFENRTIKIQEN